MKTAMTFALATLAFTAPLAAQTGGWTVDVPLNPAYYPPPLNPENRDFDITFRAGGGVLSWDDSIGGAGGLAVEFDIHLEQFHLLALTVNFAGAQATSWAIPEDEICFDENGDIDTNYGCHSRPAGAFNWSFAAGYRWRSLFDTVRVGADLVFINTVDMQDQSLLTGFGGRFHIDTHIVEVSARSGAWLYWYLNADAGPGWDNNAEAGVWWGANTGFGIGIPLQ